MKKITVALFVMAMSCVVMAQEMRQSDFLVYHNMLMKPDTMLFSFWKSGDTLHIKRILQQYVPSTEEAARGFNYRDEQGKDAVKGSRLFNGKEITYFFDQEKYFIAGDTLFKFVITNRLSADSINVLFGRKSQGRRFSKSNYERNLKIIADNRVTEKKKIFHPDFFKKQNQKVIKNPGECPDTLKLINYWSDAGKTYYQVELTYNCKGYEQTTTVLFDKSYNLLGFDKTYIDKRLSQYLKPAPFKGHYFFKDSLP
jgi:hypothetical protein